MEKSWGIEGRPPVEALHPSGLAVISSMGVRGVSSRVLPMRDSVEVGDRLLWQCVLTVGLGSPAEQTSWAAMESSVPSSPPHVLAVGAILAEAAGPVPASSIQERSLLFSLPSWRSLPSP